MDREATCISTPRYELDGEEVDEQSLWDQLPLHMCSTVRPPKAAVSEFERAPEGLTEVCVKSKEEVPLLEMWELWV